MNKDAFTPVIDEKETRKAFVKEPENTMESRLCTGFGQVLLRLANKYNEYNYSILGDVPTENFMSSITQGEHICFIPTNEGSYVAYAINGKGVYHKVLVTRKDYVASINKIIQESNSDYPIKITNQENVTKLNQIALLCGKEIPFISAEKSSEIIDKIEKRVIKLNKPLVKEAWIGNKYYRGIKTNITEASDGQDHVLLDNEVRNIYLKSVLPLVYLALTDKTVYKNNSKKDEEGRLFWLWECFEKQMKDDVCHTGLRNDLTSTLIGVYPNVWISVDSNLLIQSCMTHHLCEILDNLRINNYEYYLKALAKFVNTNSLDIYLIDKYNQTKDKLKSVTMMRLKDIGSTKSEANVHAFIDNYLKYVSLPSISSDTFMHHLIAILNKVNDKKTMHNKALNTVKKWIKNIETHKNIKESERVIADFCLIGEAYKEYKKYNLVIRHWDQNKITEQMITSCYDIILRYYTNCISLNSPAKLSEENERKVEHFSDVCNDYKSDMEVSWIENFFANWDKISEDKNIPLMESVYRRLIDGEMKKKYLASDTYLVDIFKGMKITAAQDNTTLLIDLDPYAINRIFLHAIVTPPSKWAETFYIFFCDVYRFVSTGFDGQNVPIQAGGLLKSSYIEALMIQLKYLKEHYEFINNKDGHLKKLKRIREFFIPMLHIVHSPEQLCFLLNIFPAENRLNYLLGIPKEMFKKHILNAKKDGYLIAGPYFGKTLVRILEKLSPLEYIKFIDYLGDEYINSRIFSDRELACILVAFSKEQVGCFLNKLEDKKLQALVYNTRSLINVFSSIHNENFKELTDRLSNEHLSKIICNIKELKTMLSGLNKEKRIEFLKSIDKNILIFIFQDYIKRDPEQSSQDWTKSFRDTFCYIKQSVLPFEFLLDLGSDVVLPLITNKKALALLHRHLPERKFINFINGLSVEFLRKTLTNIDGLIFLLIECPSSMYWAILGAINSEFLQEVLNKNETLIQIFRNEENVFNIIAVRTIGQQSINAICDNKEKLGILLFSLRKEERISFIKFIKPELLRSIFTKDSSAMEVLIEVLKTVARDDKVELINYLENDFLTSITKDADNLVSLISAMPRKDWHKCLQFFCKDPQQNVIENRGDVVLFIVCLLSLYLFDLTLKKATRVANVVLKNFLEENGLDSSGPFSINPTFGETDRGVFEISIRSLDPHFLKNVIKQQSQLRWVLYVLDESNKKRLIECYDKKELINVIKCPNDLFYILDIFKNHKKIKFLHWLGINTLQDIIKDGHGLVAIFKDDIGIDKKSLLLFFAGSLSALIKSHEQLLAVLDVNQANDRLSILENINNDILDTIITSAGRYKRVLTRLKAAEQRKFILSTKKTKLKAIITNKAQLLLLLNNIHISNISTLLARLGFEEDGSQTIINRHDIKWMLNHLDETNRLEKIISLDKKTVKRKIIKNGKFEEKRMLPFIRQYAESRKLEFMKNLPTNIVSFDYWDDPECFEILELLSEKSDPQSMRKIINNVFKPITTKISHLIKVIDSLGFSNWLSYLEYKQISINFLDVGPADKAMSLYYENRSKALRVVDFNYLSSLLTSAYDLIKFISSFKVNDIIYTLEHLNLNYLTWFDASNIAVFLNGLPIEFELKMIFDGNQLVKYNELFCNEIFKSSKSLAKCLQTLSTYNRFSKLDLIDFLVPNANSVSRDKLASIVSNVDRLIDVLDALDIKEWPKLFEKLHALGILNNILKNHHDLVSFFKKTYDLYYIDKWSVLFNCLYKNDVLSNIVTDGIILKRVLEDLFYKTTKEKPRRKRRSHIPVTTIDKHSYKFLMDLDVGFLRYTFCSIRQLADILPFANNRQIQFMERLGINYIIENIKDCSGLIYFLGKLKPASQEKFITAWLQAPVVKLIPNYKDLTSADSATITSEKLITFNVSNNAVKVTYCSKGASHNLVKTFRKDDVVKYFKQLIVDKISPINITDQTTKRKILQLIKPINNLMHSKYYLLESITFTIDNLASIVKAATPNCRLTLLNCYDDAILSNGTDLHKIIALLNDTDKVAFLKRLGVNFLRHIVENYKQLSLLRTSLINLSRTVDRNAVETRYEIIYIINVITFQFIIGEYLKNTAKTHQPVTTYSFFNATRNIHQHFYPTWNRNKATAYLLHFNIHLNNPMQLNIIIYSLFKDETYFTKPLRESMAYGFNFKSIKDAKSYFARAILRQNKLLNQIKLDTLSEHLISRINNGDDLESHISRKIL